MKAYQEDQHGRMRGEILTFLVELNIRTICWIWIDDTLVALTNNVGVKESIFDFKIAANNYDIPHALLRLGTILQVQGPVESAMCGAYLIVSVRQLEKPHKAFSFQSTLLAFIEGIWKMKQTCGFYSSSD